MSRHIFKTTHDSRPVEVAAGWDRPLQGFYLTVLYTDDTEDYEFAFNNLETENAHPDQFDGFRDILTGLNITLPVGMIEAIEQDRRYNVGNKIVEWQNVADRYDPEQGAASLLIDLTDGVITVSHGSDKAVLGRKKNAQAGDWDKLCLYLREGLGVTWEVPHES